MNKREICIYTCEFCGKEFTSLEECEEHEKSHENDYSEASDEVIAEDLEHLSETAYRHSWGNSVMGMSLKSFERLMAEAAWRLKHSKGVK